MFCVRLLQAIVVAVLAATISQAAWYDYVLLARSAPDLIARQNNNNSSSSAPAVVTTSPPATTTSRQQSTTTTPTQPPTNPGSEPPTSTETSTTTSPTTRPTSNDRPTSTDTRQTTPATAPTTAPTPAPEPTESTTTTTSINPATATKIIQTTLVVTDAAGAITQVLTTATLTGTAALAAATDSSGASKGMDTKTRNTVIGVCVGVGGAIILGVIGLLIWRLRRKRQNEADDDLVNYGAGTSQFNNAPDKTEASNSAQGQSPFQSTLESYHAPVPNASANF